MSKYTKVVKAAKKTAKKLNDKAKAQKVDTRAKAAKTAKTPTAKERTSAAFKEMKKAAGMGGLSGSELKMAMSVKPSIKDKPQKPKKAMQRGKPPVGAKKRAAKKKDISAPKGKKDIKNEGFGAMSESEMKLAKDTAMPMGLSAAELKKFKAAKKKAVSKSKRK